MKDYPKQRVWVGTPCGRCASTNTVLEVYDYSRERYCLTCARYNTFS